MNLLTYLTILLVKTSKNRKKRKRNKKKKTGKTYNALAFRPSSTPFPISSRRFKSS